MAKMRVRVTGKYEVGGASPGETVELDPDRVNVNELIRVGMVEPVDMAAPAPERSGQTRSKARGTTTASPESGD